MTLKELADQLHGELVGDPNLQIERVSPFESAGPGCVTLAVGRHREDLTASDASAFIVPADGATETERERFTLILSRSPKVAFAQAIALFHVPAYRAGGIAPDFVAGEGTEIGEDATIAPRVTVGRNCRIGNRVTLRAGTVIGDDVTIGDDCVFFPNVTVYDRARIGHRVVLHAGTVIGSDGFGYAQDELGRHVKIPQIGDVAIEDDVEMGANCCIDRATFGTTRIGRGTKLDNLVHIAHNCEVGEYTVMAAQVGISGSVKIGRHVTIAGQVGTNPHVTIGDGALVVGKTGVSKHVAPGSQVAGMPTQTLKDWKLTHIYASQLPTRLPMLESRVAALEEDVKKHRSDE